ncbi:ComEC/Rec2 family competence protein [Granulicella tundricola]|uniref:DNA internalization-related competence protein ComEC/Rec2 n=1 Tax=Granulicella tundricola (strain ATCC BAA-1859 / DSM 23138 / MP5ACTX9) TaxID=1198114 RepID=E8X3Y7_GRATM|nr:ComEC/Rec2 family competence protein [Granulicella tundricola]ADW70495.1 DNA internalization-related competence protein ComEC/Rec2 [Granulicella tundricola MP5ACTX9]
MIATVLTLLTVLAIWSLCRSERPAWLPVAAIWLTLGLAAAEWQPSPASIALTPYTDGLSRHLTARIIRIHTLPPEAPTPDADQIPVWEATDSTPETENQPQAISADLALASIEQVTPDTSTEVPITGTIRATLYSATPIALRCGQPITATLRIKPLERYRDPGAWQYADYLATQGVVAHASAPASDIHATAPPIRTLPCLLADSQSWAAARLLAFTQSPQNRGLPELVRLSQQDAGMLNAMLFGDRTVLNHTLRLGFERTGSFHLFVVSGLHIALLAGAVFWLLRLIRTPRWLATLLTLAAATFYAALTGFGQPAQRSLAMVAVFLLARLLSRDRDGLNALGAAALALLLWDPSTLFDASLQMTILAVIAIAGLAHPIAQRTFLPWAAAARQAFRPRRRPLPPALAQLRLTLELFGEHLSAASHLKPIRYIPAQAFRLILWTLELALVGIVVELVMALPMAIFFHRAAVFALPANMLVLPVIAILAPAAVATFVASLINPWLAILPGTLTATLLHTLTSVISHISHLKSADVRIPPPSPWIAAAALAAWLTCCWAVRRSRAGTVITAAVLPLIAVAILWPEPPILTPNTLEITALDVGQGDSLLAVSPEGRTMLIDSAGPIGRHGQSEVLSTFDIGEQVVSPYLWSRRLRQLDIVVLTHAHTDHMGGLPAILQNFHPHELWVGIDPHSALYAALLAQAARLNIRVRHLHTGDHVQWGSIPIEVLSPSPTYLNPGPPKNDDSLVLHMQYGQSSALLEGDAERPSEAAMLAAKLIHPVTLLKVGHHGSNTSTIPAFLAATAPIDAAISSGRGNPFGHPRAEVIGRLAAQHTHLFRTDELGLTTFLLTPDGRIREVVNSTPLPVHSP